MAVKNARNFVRDVNTRKICYSFCHPKMAFLQMERMEPAKKYKDQTYDYFNGDTGQGFRNKNLTFLAKEVFFHLKVEFHFRPIFHVLFHF